jgi:hypothetical protein
MDVKELWTISKFKTDILLEIVNRTGRNIRQVRNHLILKNLSQLKLTYSTNVLRRRMIMEFGSHGKLL